MTQRSIPAGPKPTVIIKAGASVTVRGQEGELVTAETDHKWGLTIAKRSEAEFARARAAVGEHVLFDLHLKKPGGEAQQDVIEVQMGGSGEVLVPFESNLKVYAGKDIDVRGVKGVVDAYAGRSVELAEVYGVRNASAGGKISLDCETVLGEDVEFKAGSDIRFHIHDLTNARIRVKDLGGYWEGRIGDGQKSVYLKCGGDVTLVTDQKVEPMPPDYVLGKIEKPGTP